MKMLGKLTMADMYRLYELGHDKMSEFLKQGRNLNEMCASIDLVMPENIKLWLDSIMSSNPLLSGQEVEIDGNTMLLLHHTAHFFMNVAVGMVIENDLLNDMPIMWDKGDGKLS